MKNQELLTSVGMIDAIRNKHLCTDYRVAKLLEMTPQNISSIRCQRTIFGEETILKIAELLGEEPAFLLACLQAEKAARADHFGVAEVWKKAALSLSQVAVLVVVFAALLEAPRPAAAGLSVPHSVYYVQLNASLIPFQKS
jgi:plasmid maintenance system antidote protein VapI